MTAILEPSPLSADARCPHVVFRNLLGPSLACGLFGYAAARAADFQPARVRGRKSEDDHVDPSHRDCLFLPDLGPFQKPVETAVREIIPRTISQLRLKDVTAEPREFEISSYGHGGRFGAHIDTTGHLHQVRIISCIYYFSLNPPRFNGGQLRLYRLPSPSAERQTRSVVDIEPETDSLVAFPSWLPHEVLAVSVPSGEWNDRRFAVSCWIHSA